VGADELRETVVLKGIGVSPGIVSGKAYVLSRQEVRVPQYVISGKGLISGEVDRFHQALSDAEAELADIRSTMKHVEGIGPMFIDINTMLLRDKGFIEKTEKKIHKEKINAEWALSKTLDEYRTIFENMSDEYLRGRVKDVEDVVQRILRNLSGKKHEKISDIGEEVIIIARDLSPADTAQMSDENILGFAIDMGSKTSHTAIIAKSLEIPAVVGLERITAEIMTNDMIIVDGNAGVVIVNPSPDILKRYEEKKWHFKAQEEDLLKDAHLPATTKDNFSIAIGANIEFIEEIPSAVSHGASGIGLYRTEFIYVNKERLPTEEEHFSHYKSVLEGNGIAWTTIRTFDFGGDKFMSDPRLSDEINPAMGLRAIRFCLREVELFRVQLRAIMRASVYGKTGVMFPMISGVGELRAARRIIDEVQKELVSSGVAINEKIEIGVMIEVPSAVMVADILAREVDFFSIGTNDLIQYALAIDRVNEQVTYLYRPLHPAILRFIKHVVDAGHNAGIKVNMCGEMAGDPLCTMVLIGFELDGLSMTPLAIPRVKRIIRESTLEESKKLLEKVLTFSEASDVEAYVEAYMKGRFPEYLSMNND
jgi:phosphotransferase system enzyme I (PtsI)